jgi:DNA primase
MGGINESVIEEVKSRIDLVDLISSYGVAVKQLGGSVKACCPFHNEKTPSFHINQAKGFYHCFGCGESGDAIKFVQKQEGLSFIDAVRKLAGQCGLVLEERADPEAGRRKRLFALMAELANFYHRCLDRIREAERARAYLAERDLAAVAKDAFLLGYAPAGISVILKWAEKNKFTLEELEAAGVVKGPSRPGDRGYHRFGGRLMFPIRDRQGRVVAFSGRQLVEQKNSGKYVNSPVTPIFKKSSVLFGFDRAARHIAAAPHREAIVCEGQIDTIRLHVSGFPVAVASQGTAFTEEHVKMLKKVADQVTLVFDDDAAGHKAAIRTAGLFLAAEMPVRVVSLPEGDDPDSYLRKHPAEDFQKLLDDAESIMSFQVRAEKAKETNPDSIDAMARVTKAILGTIAQSKNAVIRAGMVGEAAKLLGVPSAALSEELGKIKVEARKPVKSTVDAEDAFEDDFSSEQPTDWPADQVEEAVEGKDAHRVIPPPPRELALCAFLMANEYDRTLDGMLGEYLPPKVFAHDFTRRFIETWRAEVVKNEDLLQDFAGKLEGHEREWFDSVLLGGGKTESSGLSATDILQDFVRSLWADELKRERGSLPASGDAEADLRRMKLSMDLKRLSSVRWAAVKDMVRDWLQ